MPTTPGNPTPTFQLQTWAATDKFNYLQLRDNWDKIDVHDHTGGIKGVQIGPNAIAGEAVTTAKIADAAITGGPPASGVKIASGTITKSNINTTTTTSGQWIIPRYIGTLPSSPSDGDEIYFIADSASSTIWHLRYTTASSKNRWEYIGGGFLRSDITTASSAITNPTIYTAIGSGASVTTPAFSGICNYRIDFFANLLVSAAVQTFCTPKGSAGLSALDGNAFSETPTAAGYFNGYRSIETGAIAAGTGAVTFTLNIKVASNATVTPQQHGIIVRPIYIA